MHGQLIATSGGGSGLRDVNGLETAIAQPRMTFDGVDLYPNLTTKVAALGHSLITNHPFVDGNKRIGHAAMEVMLVLNGYELSADVDEQETIILSVASGTMSREEFSSWVERRVVVYVGASGIESR